MGSQLNLSSRSRAFKRTQNHGHALNIIRTDGFRVSSFIEGGEHFIQTSMMAFRANPVQISINSFGMDHEAFVFGISRDLTIGEIRSIPDCGSFASCNPPIRLPRCWGSLGTP